MKTLKFTVPLLLALVLLSQSGVIAQEASAREGGVILAYTPTVPAKATVPASVDGDGQRLENDSPADSSSSELTTAIQPERLILDDPYLDNQWALGQLQLLALWLVTAGNPEILVAVLDTGIDQNHEDLKGKVVAEVNFTVSPSSDDIYGHGTHIAGIIAANSNNGIGIAGVAPQCRLMNVKVADDKGRCQASTVARGIIWAVDNGASVINISVEIRESSAELEEAINYAWNQGAIVVAAASNITSEAPVYPAYYENCIAVVATRQDGTIGPLSNYGDWVDVAAPGFNIYSTLPGNSYGDKSGTSFASAYVSGLAALLFDIVIDNNNNGRLNDEVRAAIEAGCQKNGFIGVDIGQIDAIGSLTEMGYTFEFLT